MQLVEDHAQSCQDIMIIESILWYITAAQAIDRKLSFFRAGVT